MARATRMALDLALVSLRNVQPAFAGLWKVTKSALQKTAAKSIVNNQLICKVETSLDKLIQTLTTKLISLRDRQLPGEIKYLEKELEKVRRRMGNDGTSSKTIKPKVASAWQYAKTEMVPPMTLDFFHGPVGKKIEDIASVAANNLIDGLQNGIKAIDAEEQRQIKAKEAAIKAEIEKKKAEMKKIAEEKAMKEAKMRAEKDKQAEAAAEAAKAEKPKDPPKKEQKKAPVAKKQQKKK